MGTETPLLVGTPLLLLAGTLIYAVGRLITYIRPVVIRWYVRDLRRVVAKVLNSCISVCSAMLQEIETSSTANTTPATANASDSVGGGDGSSGV